MNIEHIITNKDGGRAQVVVVEMKEPRINQLSGLGKLVVIVSPSGPSIETSPAPDVQLPKPPPTLLTTTTTTTQTRIIFVCSRQLQQLPAILYHVERRG